MKGQLTIFDFITEQSEFDRDDFLTWCDSCKYNVNGCCDYDEPLGRVCIEGSGYSRTTHQDMYFKENQHEQNHNYWTTG